MISMVAMFDSSNYCFRLMGVLQAYEHVVGRQQQ
jgi:hypothetical protein